MTYVTPCPHGRDRNAVAGSGNCEACATDEERAKWEPLLANYNMLSEFMRALKDALVARRAKEPEHSREDHECPECVMLDDWLRRTQEQTGAKE